MFKPTYTPVQLGYSLFKTIEKQKRELNKPKSPEIKTEWIKNTSDVIINAIETEALKFNKSNSSIQILGNDIVSALQTTIDRLLRAMGIKPNT